MGEMVEMELEADKGGVCSWCLRRGLYGLAYRKASFRVGVDTRHGNIDVGRLCRHFTFETLFSLCASEYVRMECGYRWTLYLSSPGCFVAGNVLDLCIF